MASILYNFGYYTDLLVDPDIPIEYFQMITVDAMEKGKKVLTENVKLTALRQPHVVVQDTRIEALSYAHDPIPRQIRIRFRIVAEFTIPPVFESMFHITDGEESCAVS